MSTHNIGFYEEISKIIFKLSSSAVLMSTCNLISFMNEYAKLISPCYRTRYGEK